MHSSLRRGLAAVGILALVATAGGHALAASPPPTAQLTGAADVLSGSAADLTFTVSNPVATDGSTPATINSVRIVPPANLTILTASATNWTPKMRTDRSVQLTATSETPLPAGVAPGQTVAFLVKAAAAPVPADLKQTWKVATSTNGGSSFSTATAPAGATLTSTVRVLQVVGTPTIDFVTANTATAEQDTLKVSYSVRNWGSQALDVTPAISGTSGDRGAATTAVPLLTGETAALTVPVVFGTAGTARKLTVGATADTSAANTVQTAPYSVQAPAVLSISTAAGEFLSPSTARSGDSPAFKLRVAQNAGTPAVAIAETSTLAFSDTSGLRGAFVAGKDAVATTTTPAGKTDLNFSPTLVPSGSQDGAYTTTLTVKGVDTNGARFEQVLAPAGAFSLDNVAPITDLSITTGRRARSATNTVNDPANPYIAKRGDAVTLSGAIRPAAGSAAVDTAAEVTCSVAYYDASDAAVGTPSSATCSNSTGALTGSHTVPAALDSSATRGVVEVVTADAAGNSSTATAPFVLDLTAPVIVAAETGCANPADTAACANQYAAVRLTLSEPVYGTFLPADFTLKVNDTPLVVQQVLFDGSENTFGSQLSLVLARPMAEDDQPTVAFAAVPRTPLQTAPSDQAGAPLTSLTDLQATDRIAPVNPLFSKVDSKTPFEGAFYTSDGTADVELAQWTRGHTVRLYRETGATAGLDATDAIVCEAKNDTSGLEDKRTDTCALETAFASTDGSYVLYAQMTDVNGNTSRNLAGTVTSRAATVVLDTVAPKIIGAVADASGITVTFDGPIVSGRNSASDWTVTSADNAFVVGGVSAPTSTTRRLAINDADWSGDFAQVIYLSESADENDWYTDRADNRSQKSVFVK